jgi:UDP-N-acetylglucosamine diphosphorylase / glucose-1-phosphate thymidylyltransferase / UDP-N-acetylgalactosamine diphosphorylase / glucosamine-1-phosphate N-acetyltransferase / galactosamine-1-phosphate N-acetyltransferase
MLPLEGDVMQAVILAAGEGKRLRPFTETMPKVMLPIANKPVLEYVVDAVKHCGIKEIIMVVGYKKEVIMDYFKDYGGVNITYVVQEKQLGTSHALLQAKDKISDSFIVLSGDNIVDDKTIQQLIVQPSEYCIVIKEHPSHSKYGVVFVEKTKLKELVEKPKDELGTYISTGIYKLSNNVFECIELLASQGIFALSSVIQALIDKGISIQTVCANFWMDIVYPWDLISVNEVMIRQLPKSISGVIEKGVVIKGPVSVGKDTTIYSGCYIVGPVVIGDGCEIGPNTCIFPSTIIGDNSSIRPFCELRNSIIMEDVHIHSSSYLSHCIIARGNTISSNFSNITGKAIVETEDEIKKIRHIGAMIGEDCYIGSNVVVEAGITIGRRCKIDPLKKISKNVASDSKVV